MAEEAENLRDEDYVEENQGREDQQETENQIDPKEFKRLQEEKQKIEKRLKEVNESDKKRRLRLKELEETLGDTDPEEIQRWKQEREEAEREKAEKKGQFEKLRQQIEEQRDKEKQQYETELKQMSATLEKHVIDGSIAQAMSKYDAEPEMSDVLLSYIRPQFKMVKEDGEYKQRVVDDHGDPQLNMEGEYKTVDDVFKELKESSKFSRFFRGNRASGGGSVPGGDSSGKSAPPKFTARDQMSNREKLDYIKQYGQAEYEKIPVTTKKAR